MCCIQRKKEFSFNRVLEFHINNKLIFMNSLSLSNFFNPKFSNVLFSGNDCEIREQMPKLVWMFGRNDIR